VAGDGPRDGTGGQVLLEAGSFLAGLPIALVVLLVGARFGGVGALVAGAALVAAAAHLARSGFVALAGGLLAGLAGVVLLLWLLEATRPDY
jgi:hypothetical protein